MSGSTIPEKLINFRLYKGGVNLIGVVDVDVSGGESLSETISGAGIAGEIESQTLGHTSPIVFKINFRQPTKEALALFSPGSHDLELRGSHQARDASGNYVTSPDRVVIRGTPKTNLPAGKYEVGKPMGQELEFAVDYIKRELGGVEVFEIDKLNFIHSVNGVDVLASVRSDLGM